MGQDGAIIFGRANLILIPGEQSPNRRVCSPCMITLREPTNFDVAAPGDVARISEKSKDENLEAREIYAQKPYNGTLSPNRNLALLGNIFLE